MKRFLHQDRFVTVNVTGSRANTAAASSNMSLRENKWLGYASSNRSGSQKRSVSQISENGNNDDCDNNHDDELDGRLQRKRRRLSSSLVLQTGWSAASVFDWAVSVGEAAAESSPSP